MGVGTGGRMLTEGEDAEWGWTKHEGEGELAEHAGGRPGVRRRRCERGSHFAQQNDGLPLVSFGGGREGGREQSTQLGRSLPRLLV